MSNMDNKIMEKFVMNVLQGILENKERDIAFDLKDFEIRTPWSKQPLKVSGKLTVEFSTKKKKK